MRVVAIETVSQRYSCALWAGSQVELRQVSQSDPDFDGVAELVQSTLRIANWESGQVDLVLASRGPGRVTTIRSGLAYGQAWSYACGAAFETCDTYQATAASARREVGSNIELLVAGVESASHARDTVIWFRSGDSRGRTIDVTEGLTMARQSEVAVVQAFGSRRPADSRFPQVKEVSVNAWDLVSAWRMSGANAWNAANSSQILWERI